MSKHDTPKGPFGRMTEMPKDVFRKVHGAIFPDRDGKPETKKEDVIGEPGSAALEVPAKQVARNTDFATIDVKKDNEELDQLFRDNKTPFSTIDIEKDNKEIDQLFRDESKELADVKKEFLQKFGNLLVEIGGSGSENYMQRVSNMTEDDRSFLQGLIFATDQYDATALKQAIDTYIDTKAGDNRAAA